MSVRGQIIVKETGGPWKLLMPFVGLNPDRALTDVMRKGFARARFEPHAKGGPKGVA